MRNLIPLLTAYEKEHISERQPLPERYLGLTDAEMESLIKDLQKVLDLIDMGDIKWFLGMEITHDCAAQTVTLSQAAYINTIAHRFSMQDSHPVSTPLDMNVILSKDLCPKDDEARHLMMKVPYLSGVGSLMYMSMATHPDITYTTNKLSQFSADPGTRHWTALQRVIQYLIGTRNTVLVLGGTNPIALVGWADADFARCLDTCQSTSRFMFSLGSGAISWSSKRQATVSTLTCEAKYIASCHAMKEALWLRKLMTLLGHPQDTTKIWNNNAGSIILTKDPSFHACTKHIDIQYHFVCEWVQSNKIIFKYLHTAEMPADMLTKSLAHPKHIKFSAMFGLRS